MARRPVAITVASAVSAALVLGLTLGTIGAVAARADGFAFNPADWGALWFTVWQALVSALLSVGFAVPLARALARRTFPGRPGLIAVMGAPFILPVIVAVLGLLAVFGRGGWANAALGAMGLPQISIYGIDGVLLAHVFFNLPLATRLILQGWATVPSEHLRLSQTLDFSGYDRFRIIEFPILREVLPGAFTAIFVICTTSFAVALALGGGPRATTVELAIYEAFRFDFDLGRASMLAVVQLGICAIAGIIAAWVGVPRVSAATLDRKQVIPAEGGLSRVADAAIIICGALFLLTPLLAIAMRGLPQVLDLPVSVWTAAFRSVIMALGAAMLGLMISLPLAFAASRAGVWGRTAETVGFLTIAASPLVMGIGLYILLIPHADPVSLALPLTVIVNAAMALPFTMRALTPPIAENTARFMPLAQSLDMPPSARLRLIWWPRLRRPMGFSAGLAAALSMGDLGVITLFAAPDQATLPLQMYRLMSAYRIEDAMGAALVLLSISLALFWILDRGGRIGADT